MFNDKQIQNLKPTGARYEVREGNAHGNGTLALRVGPTGQKSWQYLYRFDGKVRRMTLGAYPAMTVAEAHKAAGDAMQRRERGIDPGAATVETNAAARKAPTFKELADRYIDEWATPRKKSAERDRRALKTDLIPTWGTRKAESIQKADVRALLKTIVDRGAPIQANRTLALLRKLFNWAWQDADLVPGNPCLGIKAPGVEHKRERALSDLEIRKVIAKLPTTAMADETKLALLLVLLTTQRCGEVLAMRWDEVDLKSGWWTIPGGKAKNKLPHRVPLSPEALEVLTVAKLVNPDREIVFASPRGDKPMVETAVARALARNLDHLETAHFTPHDLRRSAATALGSMGTAPHVLGKILNHKDQGPTAIYNRATYDGEKRAALDIWGKRIAVLAAAKDDDAAGPEVAPTVSPKAAQVPGTDAPPAMRAARGQSHLRVVRGA